LYHRGIAKQLGHSDIHEDDVELTGVLLELR